MKKLALFAFSALALTACGKAEAPAAASTRSTTNANLPMASMSGMAAGSTAPAAKTGVSTGVVVSVDASAGTITLDHQAIPGVGWPPMTMTFKVTPRSLLNGVRAGDHVKFSVRVEGDNSEVTAIEKQH